MPNPFESGHIKNYLLLYASIVVIMILFFIASTLFNDIKDVKKKEFNTQMKQNKEVATQEVDEEPAPRFKLLDTAY